MKGNVYSDFPSTIRKLIDKIAQATGSIGKDTLKNVYENFGKSLWFVLREESGLFDQEIKQKLVVTLKVL